VGNKRREDHEVNPENCGRNPDIAQGKDLVPVEQPIYQIMVKGHLSDGWAEWFEGLTICQEKDGLTVLTGPIADQAALHGLLVRIRNLCLPLVSVNRVAKPSPGSGPMAAEE
jgi:hypothetical protein